MCGSICRQTLSDILPNYMTESGSGPGLLHRSFVEPDGQGLHTTAGLSFICFFYFVLGCVFFWVFFLGGGGNFSNGYLLMF